jgi:transposase
LRGIDAVSAIGLVSEIGDINRFTSARQLMGYLGLVPSEHSSGNSIHRGSITKTGNAHARRLLTEAAWNYRFPARLSRNLRDRSDSVHEAVRSHAWKAQVRLCGRFARLSSRGVPVNKICVAVPASWPDSSGPCTRLSRSLRDCITGRKQPVLTLQR